jgi:hypothetical protein
VVFEAVQGVVLFYGPPLAFGDVRLEEIAPPDDPNEQIEQDRLDAADDDLQVPVAFWCTRCQNVSPSSGSNRNPPPQKNQ